VPTIWVSAASRRYPVFVEPGGIDAVGARIRERLDPVERAVVIADARAARLHGSRLRRSLRAAELRTAPWTLLGPGEARKSLGGARRLYDALLAAGVDRWTPVIVLGGGVAGDLAGFAASTFLRGLPVVHVPTTVVAQVDSSVGGKTAVNYAGAKNLVGTFHQPALVVADPETLRTLPDRDFRAGLAEVVKIGVTLRPDMLERIERETGGVLARNPDLLAELVAPCVAAKGEIIARDEKDEDVRAILNYGHTVGHAVEGASGGRIRHGEAVAVGMNAAAWVGERLGVAGPEIRERQNVLLAQLGLKGTARGVDKRRVLRNLKLDKKVRAGGARVVLTLQMGAASVWPQISPKLLRDAVSLVLE
jgi:3-dehydroquinate synthase